MNVRRIHGPNFRTAALFVLLPLLFVSCGGNDDVGGTEGGSEPVNVKVSFATFGTTPLRPAILDYADDFGLDVSEDDVQVFDSHATAIQVLLAGQSDIVGGSFLGDLLVIDEGEDIKVFCPGETIFVASVVGLDDVTDLSQLADPDVRVGVDSEGGAINYFMNLLLNAKGLGFHVEDLTNTKVLEDTSLRTAALINGEIDAAMINEFEVPQVIEALGEDRVNILSFVPDDVSNGIFIPFAATTEWLEKNQETAAAFCAAVLKGTRAYIADYDTWAAAVRRNLGAGEEVDEDVLRKSWEVAEKTWATANTLTQDVVDENIQVAVDMGLLDAPLAYEDVVDPRPIERALELLEEAE